MKKIFWLITNFEKGNSLKNINFEELKLLAKEHNFDAEIVFITRENCISKNEFIESVKENKEVAKFYMYKSNFTENECIYNALSFNEKADNYFVCDAKYLIHSDIISSMLYSASFYGIKFVRCKKYKNESYTSISNVISKYHNKVVNMFCNSNDSKYIRNFVVFDAKVYKIMMENRMQSAVVRESDMLVLTNTIVYDVDKKFKKAHHRCENWVTYLVSSFSILLSLWFVACLVIMRPNFNELTWFLLAIIVFGVIGYISLNYAFANSKFIFYRPFVKRKPVVPMTEEEVQNSKRK